MNHPKVELTLSNSERHVTRPAVHRQIGEKALFTYDPNEGKEVARSSGVFVRGKLPLKEARGYLPKP